VGSYPLALNIISDCWILFAIIWLIAAIWTRRSIYKESRWQRLGYVIPILVGGYLAFKGQRLSDPLKALRAKSIGAPITFRASFGSARASSRRFHHRGTE